MENKIRITGYDIIGWSGLDETGALKELGIDFTPLEAGYCQNVAAMEFWVDLDFVIKHELWNNNIYNNFYKGSPKYLEYYNLGAEAFNKTKSIHEDNPFNEDTERRLRTFPWYEGFREAKDTYFKEKYKLGEFQTEVRGLIEKYGLILDYCAENNRPYIQTPEGYIGELV